MEIRDIVMSTGMSARPEYYSGYGITTNNLNSKHLQLIYEGIEKYYSKFYAKQFVKFVAKLPVMSATAFLNNLYDFVSNDFSFDDMNFESSDIAIPRGDGSIINLFAALSTMKHTTKDKPNKTKMSDYDRESEQIKEHYLTVMANASVRKTFLLMYNEEAEDAKKFKEIYGANVMRISPNNPTMAYRYKITN